MEIFIKLTIGLSVLILLGYLTTIVLDYVYPSPAKYLISYNVSRNYDKGIGSGWGNLTIKSQKGYIHEDDIGHIKEVIADSLIEDNPGWNKSELNILIINAIALK